MKTIHYLGANGVLSSEWNGDLSDHQILEIYRTMLLTRKVDERMVILQRQGEITFSLSSAGEEACAAASAAALELADWMYPQYRELGVMFWRGWSVRRCVHHMFGDAEDGILGRQMPNHFGDKRLNVVTVSSPIGTNIPHAAGCAYAMKLQDERSVAISYFGEGATSEGDFHVGLNFAAVRKCPVIFFCRNNGYAISTPVSAQFASEGVAPKGEGYGIKTFRVDGNDVFAIYDTVVRAKAHCLQGKGPVLIEAMTYRLGAHSTSDDPTRYRSEEEVEEWRKSCPILRLRRYLESKQLWDEAREQALLDEIAQEIDDAVVEAKETPPPPLETVIEDVYNSVPITLREQLEE